MQYIESIYDDIKNCIRYYMRKNYPLLLLLTDNEWIKLIKKCYKKIDAPLICFNQNEIIANEFKKFYSTVAFNTDLHCKIWHAMFICLNFDCKRLQYIYQELIKSNIDLKYVHINYHILLTYIIDFLKKENKITNQIYFRTQITNDFTYYQQISYILYNIQVPHELTKLLIYETLELSTNIIKFLYKQNTYFLIKSNIYNYYIHCYHYDIFQHLNWKQKQNIIKSYKSTMKLLQILIEKNQFLDTKIITQYLHITQYTQYKINKYFINLIIQYLIDTKNFYLLDPINTLCNLTEKQKQIIKPYINKLHANNFLLELK